MPSMLIADDDFHLRKLVLVMAAFMWVFQIHFMERNYIESNISEVQAQVEAVLAKLFTSPILAIKKAVDALAAGDLTAKQGLKRRDEIGQLSCSVEKLGQALRRVDVLREEVIANVSHELRSPLALIGGYAEMVRDVTWKDDTQREENLNLIISEANRMSVMVSDILDYSQLQSGCLQLNRGGIRFM